MNRHNALLFLMAASAVSIAAKPICAAQKFEQAAVIGGSAAAWGDYNNDGWVDLHSGEQLWRNEKGTLVKVADAPTGSGIWGDYDNDGYLDYFAYGPHKLYHNLRGLSFQEVPFPKLDIDSPGACWGDFNGDGYLDLYVCGYEVWPTAYYPDMILTNNNNGTFSVTWTQGNDAVTTPGRPRPARGASAADWDLDGDLDLYVSNYRIEPNALWRNDGKGVFTDLAGTHNALATSDGFYGGHSIGAAWGDFDNDGLLDIFAGNFAHPGQPQSRFLRNKGKAVDYAFEDMGPCGIPYQESYASPSEGDIDNDGKLDLYFTTVYPNASGGVKNYPSLFHNEGGFKFNEVTTDWGLPKTGDIATYQAAFADYDHDGHLDLAANGILYHNTGGKSHWLEVQLSPKLPGTQVTLVAGDKKYLRNDEGSVGQGNQNDAAMHFGLGDYKGRVRLEIRWPGSKKAQRVKVGSVDRIIVVKKPH